MKPARSLRELQLYCDDQRHLVCFPHSVENLHLMAQELGIRRCWFHKDHYDIPKGRVDDIKKVASVVSPKDIAKIVGRTYARVEERRAAEEAGFVETRFVRDGGTYTVRWTVVPGRQRTVFAHGNPRFKQWPDMAFGIVLNRNGRPMALYAFRAHGPMSLQGHPISTSPGQNGFVCLGQEAASAVAAGRMDPVEAFWNTGFKAITHFVHRGDTFQGRTRERVGLEYATRHWIASGHMRLSI